MVSYNYVHGCGMGSFLICSVALVDEVVTLDGTLADVILVGAAVTFSPDNSSRDGERGAFIVAGALVVICGVMLGAILRQIATEPKMHK